MTNTYDVVVIGAGPGGYVAAIRAAQLGFKVACIDKGETLGGTCLNVGCIPSKALLHSTEYFDWINHSAKEHGISATNVNIDFGAMMKRKEGIVKLLVDGIASHFKKHKIERIQGEAHFLDPNTVEVVAKDGQVQTLKANNFIIATGSEPVTLPFLPFDEKKVISSTGALSLREIPKRLLIIGAGVIGIELGSVYKRLGSAVTIVEMLDTLTPSMDPLISRTHLQILKKQGLEFYLGAKVMGATINNEVVLTVEYEQKSLKLAADVVLVAVGRRPYTSKLNLDKAGVDTVKGLITIGPNFQTSQAHIYAIGDVVEGPMLAHRASHEGIAVAEHLAGKAHHLNYMSIPNVIYTHPEVAAVGLTENEAKAAGLKVIVGTNYFRGNARARCSGEIDGLVKVIADETTGRLLGMHIIGSDASEMIVEGMLALDKKATLIDLVEACHAHPTLSEAVMEACQQALGYPIHG